MMTNGDPRALEMLAQLMGGRSSIPGMPVQSDKERELQRKVDQLEDDLRSFKRSKEREIDDLRSDHARELRKREDARDDEISALKRNFEEQHTTTVSEWKARLQRAEREFDDRVAQQRNLSNQTVEMSNLPLQSKIKFLEQEVERLKSDCDRWRKLAESSDEQLRALRAEMANKEIDFGRQRFELDREIKEKEAEAKAISALSGGGSQSESDRGASAVSIIRQLGDAIPTLVNGWNALQRLNNGQLITTANDDASKKPPAPPIRASAPTQTRPVEAPPAPVTPPPSSPPMVSPPRVTPPPANNGNAQ